MWDNPFFPLTMTNIVCSSSWQECRKLRNYQSLIAIAIALDSAPVQSLELTRNYLSSNMVSQLEALVSLPDPEGNHSRYRAALNEVIDPAYRDCCIPWIGKCSANSGFLRACG